MFSLFHRCLTIDHRPANSRAISIVCFWLLLSLLLSSCGGDEYYRPEYEQPARSIVPPPSPAMEPEESASDEEQRIYPSQDNNASSSSAASARKIHYSAQIEMQVSQLNQAIENALHLADKLGGYVESVQGHRVVMQVPAERFEDALKQMQSLGKVVNQQVSAEDISDAYYDSELRLKIAKQSRDRLLQLLEQAKKEDDKLSLLRQLEEVSMEIRHLEDELAALRKKVRYSSIIIEFSLFQSFGNGSDQLELPGFHWIGGLAQFIDSSCHNKDVEFKVPDNMLLIKDLDYWRVESADEVVFQSCQRANDPAGDSAFWRNAIKFRLQENFKDIRESQQGDYWFLRVSNQGQERAITPNDELPVFYVGVKVSGDKLSWLEIKFPTALLEQKYKAAIFSVIPGAKLVVEQGAKEKRENKKRGNKSDAEKKGDDTHVQ